MRSRDVAESWDEVVASLSGAYGLKAWGSELGYGSFVTVSFGERQPGKDYGSYYLWIYMAPWRLEDAEAVLAGSEDEDRAEVAKKIAMLDGRVLISIAVEYPSLSARFEFEGGLVLTTFSESRTDEQWMFFRPDGSVITAGPGSSLWVEPASGPAESAYSARR
jgi:hypothetical protein